MSLIRFAVALFGSEGSLLHVEYAYALFWFLVKFQTLRNWTNIIKNIVILYVTANSSFVGQASSSNLRDLVPSINLHKCCFGALG
jgi:hypothetical protein